MGEVIFVVWRECFEALLVIGIIYAWMKQNPDRKNGMRYLYAGVGVGILASCILAEAINHAYQFLQGDNQTLFMIGMSVVACALIVQMVYWMNKHARSMKSSLESEMNKQVERHSWWGVLFIIAIAIAREGSEIVVFLAGKIAALNSSNITGFLTAVAIGVAVSALTFYAFILTSKIVSWKKFFTITGFILLLLAVSLLLKGVDDGTNLLLEHDFTPPEFLITTAWDTSSLIDDNGVIGGLLTSLFAYRSQPTWIDVIVFGVYWVLVAGLFSWNRHNRNKAK